MSLIRYEGAAPIATLFDGLDDLLSGGFDWAGRDLAGSLYPKVDITESEAGYTIKADLPGLAREDIRVSVADNTLSISGEKKHEHEKREKDRYYHLERNYGSFTRSFALPVHVDVKNIEAKYADGVLEVNLKKTEDSRPRSVEVKVK
jgi:HSP20 family protein